MADASNSAADIGSFRNRVLLTACIAFALIAFIGFRRPSESDLQGGSKSRFWLNKRNWSQCADIVLAGDSRTYRGLIPNEIATGLKSELSIYNFGFSAVGFTEDYLHETEKVLSDDGAGVIVLGISPNALTPKAAAQNGFTQTNLELEGQSFLTPFMKPIVAFLRPMHPRSFLNAILGKRENWRTRGGYYQDFQLDGSIPSTRVPEVGDEAAAIYARQFVNNQVSEDVVSGLIAQVESWTNKGHTVIAIRVPTSPSVFEIEEQQSGFDQESFVFRFTEAGGNWIEVDATKYHTYDGNHLHSNCASDLDQPAGKIYEFDAGRLSREVGEAINEILNETNKRLKN